MDKLPDCLLLQILSRLNDSADVARCRVAWKAFDAVFPGLRSINLPCTHSSDSFHTVFLDLIMKQETVESVSISLHDFFLITDVDHAKKWLPSVSESLKSLSLCGFQCCYGRYESIGFPLITLYCHNLVNLKLKYAWLPTRNLNPLPMLTTLTLEYTTLEDQHLNQFNKCFPNLQVLNLLNVHGLNAPKIHLLNLVTLKIECDSLDAIHVEAPMLSHFHLSLYTCMYACEFTIKRFKNLKTLLLDSLYTDSLLSQFPITKTVEDVTLDSKYEAAGGAPKDSKLILRKLSNEHRKLSMMLRS